MLTHNFNPIPKAVKRKMLVSIPLLLALVSCNTAQHSESEKKASAAITAFDASFEPLRVPKTIEKQESYTPEITQPKTQYRSGPGVNISSTFSNVQTKELTLNLTGEPIGANYHDMPLPLFINQIFGEQLGLSFTLDPQIDKQSDLVTLRIAEPIPPSELFHVAVKTLSAYGIAVSQQDKILVFTIDKNASAGETPLLVSGRTLPDVPESHRPVFMFLPLKAVTGSKVVTWVRDALTGKDIQIQDDVLRNAVLLKGKPDVVAQAISIIEVLDQPVMRGKFSTSIEPSYVKVADLSVNLREVLNAEGYDATIKQPTGSIMIVPLVGTNQLIVFASTQAILDHVREWVNTLDRRQQLTIDQGIFTYEVRNAEASHIVDILNGVETGITSDTQSTSRPITTSGASGTAISDTTSANSGPASKASQINGGNFVVDTNRNTLIYKGSGQAWADLLPVIQSLDKSAPSVLIEVLIAEVTLNDTDNAGFEFLAQSTITNNGRSYPTTLSTLGGLGVGKLATGAAAPTGFTAEAINSAGNTRAMLNLFQQNKRAEIRSRPRIMVKSGQQATIDVGTDVPTRGATTTSGAGVSLTSVGTAKTGLRLTVKPVVHASGNVDIDIDQSLSEASKNSVSDIDSPSIFNRQIKTVVTLQDGGSILLGGLISNKVDKTNAAVPWVSKVPIMGNLFKAKNNGSERTELMVMIIPYVLDTPAESQAITKTIQDAFQQP